MNICDQRICLICWQLHVISRLNPSENKPSYS